MAVTRPSEIFRKYLKEGKNRITPERFIVLDAALEYEGHFGADELYIKMKNLNARISRATVYNTLELLAQCNLLSKRNFGDNLTRYESNYRKQRHDHLVCVNCGKITEFTHPKLKGLPEEICKDVGFEFSSYSFNIFGRCTSKNCKHRKNE